MIKPATSSLLQVFTIVLNVLTEYVLVDFKYLSIHNVEYLDERESVQKKTFTKWVNSHLARVGCKIQDLYVDLRDGKMLMKNLLSTKTSLIPT